MTKKGGIDGNVPLCEDKTKQGGSVMEKTPEIYKSNSLVEASYRLTPSEQGIILSCISQIRKDEDVTDQTMYKVSVSDYIALTGADPTSAYRDIKNAALRLRGRLVKIYSLPNGGGRIKNKHRVLITGWVQSVVYSDDGGEVSLRFSHDMLPYLTNLSNNFTKYKLKDVAKMSSGYGIRLYELLVEWRDKCKTEEYEISIDQIRKTLQLEESYAAIKDFKKRVLEPAIVDVNAHSDLFVTWEQRKTGRKVTHLKFKFKTKAETKKRKTKQQNLESWKTHIEKHARAGESWEEASMRLKRKRESELIKD